MLTARDQRLIRFIARAKFATTPMLAELPGWPSIYSIKNRLRRLYLDGLLDRVETPVGRYGLWCITPESAAMLGGGLPQPRHPNPGSVRHLLGLAELTIQFEAAGELVMTEVEIRAHDLTYAPRRGTHVDQILGRTAPGPGPRFAVRAVGRNRLHIPDLVLVRPVDPSVPGSQSLAIELELTRKSPERIRQVLSAYAAATNIGGVVYYTHDSGVRDLIQRCAVATQTTGIVDVRRWEAPSEMGLVE